MKAVLFLCLLAIISCEVDFWEVCKCVIADKKVQELGLKLVSVVYTKDFSKIIPTIVNAVPDLYNAVTNCIPKQQELN